MNSTNDIDQLRRQAEDVRHQLERVLGVSGLKIELTDAGGQAFLKLQVGRRAPYYDHALRVVQMELPADHPFKGRLGLIEKRPAEFPASLEANCLLTLLTRATRKVAQGIQSDSYSVPYVPFQNGEDHKLTQPASHIIIGRRGVGKSTLISRALQLLRGGRNVAVVLDMQAYSELNGNELLHEVFKDVVYALREQIKSLPETPALKTAVRELDAFSSTLPTPGALARAPAQLRRILAHVTRSTGGDVFVFLDDFHVISSPEQPVLLQHIHGALKGANGWLKVAGLGSLLNHYDPVHRRGLQVPGDAQRVSLDLTLENPRAAEAHLESILENFVRAVGLNVFSTALPAAPFRRLVWANAGVPRDFLQMFARSLELARKNSRSGVTLSDVNVAIGEFGQQKIDEMQQDARNEQGALERVIAFLERHCLDEKKVNAFLVRSDQSVERRRIQILSDLRLVHLIHQSITPDRAGERYEAFIIDYALFTGFRRRPGIKEMLPDQGDQFKASALRKLPKLTPGFSGTPVRATLSNEQSESRASSAESSTAPELSPVTVPKAAVKKAAVKKAAVKKVAVKKAAVKKAAVKKAAVKKAVAQEAVARTTSKKSTKKMAAKKASTLRWPRA